ncbi:MAG: DNA translocase FtsK [Lachnospiraceae bacterium]|nr:DNA translocase FtsK [Lachnospiraceae bacterium]
MSGTKTGGSRKQTTGTKKKNTQNSVKKTTFTESGNGIWDEVLLVLFIIFAIFLFVSNFGVGGAVGEFLSGLLFGCFGLLAYLFPLLLLLVILFSLANRENLAAKLKVAGMVLGGIAIDALLHCFTMGKADVEGIGEIFVWCREYHTGGGIVGGGIWTLLHSAFGAIGAGLILLGILIICTVIITGRSFVRGMSDGSRKVYESTRENMERRKELSEQRKESRREQKASGVTPDLTIPKPTGDGLVELGGTKEEEPETAKTPAAKEEGTLPRKPIITIHRPEPKHYEEEESLTGGVQEIGFSEVDLMRNALNKKEFEQEQKREQIQKETVSKKEPQPEPKVTEEIPTAMPEKDAKTAAKAQPAKQSYQFPPLSLLKMPKRSSGQRNTAAELQETAGHLQQVMEDFGVNATVTNVSCGPAVTRFEVQPAHGVKVSKIVSLADDIKLNLAVPDVRIEAPIPGKAAVGIEVPNRENSAVPLRELIESEEFKKNPSKIAFAVGKDIGGNIMVSDIAKMPHLLIAGATGSGKSVCINTLIMSILYKARPDEVRLIMIDPKVVELSAYNGIPHLLTPVVTDPKKAAGALNWAVNEMMGRYNRFAETNVRNIEGYNSKIESLANIEGEKPEKMPQIVIIVDELADLMMVAPGEVEDAICRLAQLARAAGIHLVIATQRPSVNVITGLIKANMPSRIAFAVSSGVDSRTILDMNGAEKLLGKGDMLFAPSGIPKPLRVQGALVTDTEVGAVVEFLSRQKQETTEADAAIAEQIQQMQTAAENTASEPGTAAGGGSSRDVLFAEAGKFIIEKDKASIGMLQRWFKIGFNRAARIMDQLADAGVVGEEEGTKPRKILMSMEQFEQYIDEYV